MKAEQPVSDSQDVSGRRASALAAMLMPVLEPIAAAAAFLKDWPVLQLSRAASPCRLPVLDWAGALSRATVPLTAPVVQALVAGAGDLAWRQTYGAGDFGAAFLDRYGWTELIGMRGPVRSQALACGFLMLGPETTYPAHAHEAEELYVPLSGTALWQRGQEPWQARAPGTPIHHPGWMPHAMRTAAEPLLALYLWRGGDLAAKSKVLPAF